MAATRNSLVGRLLAWLFRSWHQAEPRVAAPEAMTSAAFVHPLMASAPADRPVRPTAIVANGPSLLAARLASVAKLNARSSLVARRPSIQASAGKAIPKKAAKRLKRPGHVTQTPALAPKLRVLKVEARRPAKVIELAAAKGAFAVPAQARAA